MVRNVLLGVGMSACILALVPSHAIAGVSAISVPMIGRNHSRQNGTAIVQDVPGGILVRISLANEPKGWIEPAHIHFGTCAKINPAPYRLLNNVVGGISVTRIRGLSVTQLHQRYYAINVHRSAMNLRHYVSCGTI